MCGEQNYSYYTLVATESVPHSDARAMRSLVALSHHGWVIPVIMHLGHGCGARFAVLQHRLGVGRTTLQRALAAASELDLTMRNPGYGHPLRPEYLLTPRGESIACACEGVLIASERLRTPELTRRKWTLPVLASLEGGSGRFADLQRDLTDCSPRALARALDQLHAVGWIVRHLLDERPPRASYRLAPRAKPLARAARELAVAAR